MLMIWENKLDAKLFRHHSWEKELAGVVFHCVCLAFCERGYFEMVVDVDFGEEQCGYNYI